jgi:CHAD domain-containing protein
VAPPLDAGSTIGEVIRAAIAGGVDRWLHHDPGVRLGDDDEDVHQARVATRRLRSDLRTFASLLDPTWLAGVRDELAWAADELGRVRDADVLYGRLRRQVGTLPAMDARAGAAVLRKLSAEREVARHDLLAAMDTPRYVALLDRLVQASASVPFGPDAEPGRPAADVLPGLVLRPWRHLAKAVDGLGADPPDDALHEVRKRAKRARYAAEAAVSVVGKDARRLGRAVAAVQEVLGDLQDAVVAEQWLRCLGTPGGSVERAFVAGQLCALQHRLIAAARQDWRAAWKAADAKKLRAWLA